MKFPKNLWPKIQNEQRKADIGPELRIMTFLPPHCSSKKSAPLLMDPNDVPVDRRFVTYLSDENFLLFCTGRARLNGRGHVLKIHMTTITSHSFSAS